MPTTSSSLTYDIIKLLESILTGPHGLNSMAEIFVPIGQKFLAIAVLITLTNAMYQFWIKGDIQEMIASGIRMAIVTAIPLFMLMPGNWVNTTNTLTNFFVTGLTSSVMQQSNGSSTQVAGDMIKSLMTAADMGKGTETSSINDQIAALQSEVTTLQGSSAQALLTGNSTSATLISNQIANINAQIKSLQQQQASNPNASNEGSSWNPADMFRAGFASIEEFILKVVVWVFTILLVFGVLICVYMPLAALSIGVIMGPLLLSWLPFEGMSDTSRKWFGFMLANGMTYVVAIVILNAVAGTVNGLAYHVSDMASKSIGGGIAAYMGALVGILATYIFSLDLMLQANNMASGMTGGASVGEGLFGKLAAGGAAGGMGLASAKGAKAAAQTPGAVTKGVGAVMGERGAMHSAKGASKVIAGDPSGSKQMGKGARLSKAAASVTGVGNTIQSAKAVKDVTVAGAKSAGKAAAKLAASVLPVK